MGLWNCDVNFVVVKNMKYFSEKVGIWCYIKDKYFNFYCICINIYNINNGVVIIIICILVFLGSYILMMGWNMIIYSYLLYKGYIYLNK